MEPPPPAEATPGPTVGPSTLNKQVQQTKSLMPPPKQPSGLPGRGLSKPGGRPRKDWAREQLCAAGQCLHCKKNATSNILSILSMHPPVQVRQVPGLGCSCDHQPHGFRCQVSAESAGAAEAPQEQQYFGSCLAAGRLCLWLCVIISAVDRLCHDESKL